MMPTQDSPPLRVVRKADVADVVREEGIDAFVAAVEQAKDPNEKPPFPLVRVRDIADPGPVKWLVDQLWTTAAFGIVGAEPKSWKSWLTLYLGICVASGRSVFDRFAVEQGVVAMFSAEGGNGLLRQRAAMLCNWMEIAIPDDLFAIDVPVLRIDQPETAARILATVKGSRPRLLILDPLRELHGGDENDAADIARLLDPLRSLQREGCACMLVHHLSKQTPTSRGKPSARGGQRLRGSSALHGATDSALYLETIGDGEKKRVQVQAEHRAAAEPEPFMLRLQHRKLEEKVWLEIVDPNEEVEEKEDVKIDKETKDQQQKRNQIIKAIAAACKPGRDPHRSKRSILAVVKGTKKTVDGLIDSLVEEGVVVFAGGHYYPADSVPAESGNTILDPSVDVLP